MGIQNFGEIISQKREGPRQSDFSRGPYATNPFLEKNQQERSSRGEEKFKYCLENVSVREKRL